MEAAVFRTSLPERRLTREPPPSLRGGKEVAVTAAGMSPAAKTAPSTLGVSKRRPAVSTSRSAAASTAITPSRTDCAPPPQVSLFAKGAAQSRSCILACGSDIGIRRTGCRSSPPDCRSPQPPSPTPRFFCCRDGSVCSTFPRCRSSRDRRRLIPSVAVLLLLYCLCCRSNAPPVCVFPYPATAQIVFYSGSQAPAPLSAAPQRGAFFVYDEGTHFYFPFFTSSDESHQNSTTITFKNLTFTPDSSAIVTSTLPSAGSVSPSGGASAGGNTSGTIPQGVGVSPAGIEISLLPYEYTRTIFSTPSVAPFCCTAPSPPHLFVPTPQCPYLGALKRAVRSSAAESSAAPAAEDPGRNAGGAVGGDSAPAALTSAETAAGAQETAASDKAAATGGESAGQPASSPVPAAGGGGSPGSRSLVTAPHYSQPVLLRSAGEGGNTEVKLDVKEGGIYFLVISNCGGLAQLRFDGEVQVRNAYGYLPGHEYPKMPFYFIFMLVYLGVCFLWGFLLYRQRANLIAFHKCMLFVAVLGFLECLALFVYFSDFNLRGSRSSVLLVISVLVSVVKNIFSYMLVLLGAIGWSITIPVLDRKTVVKMQIIVVLYIILDTARQVSDEFSHSHSLPLVLLLTCLFPISALNGLLFYWIISSINSNVEMLQQQKQHEKLLMYKRLYAVLLLAIFLAIIDLLCQIYVASWDASFPWKNQWWLSDAVPHFLFLLVLAAMMFIWRPNHQSKRLAYFTELGDADDLERASGENRDKPVWGEELDFHDHFSEDELEAGIPNFHLHSVGSVSDEGEFSDGEQGQAADDMRTVTELTKKGLHEEEGVEEMRSTSSRAPTAASSGGKGRGPAAQQPHQRTSAPASGPSSPPAGAAARAAAGGTRASRATERGGGGGGRKGGGEAAAEEEGGTNSTSRRGGGPPRHGPEDAVELSTTPAHTSGSSKKPAGADYH